MLRKNTNKNVYFLVETNKMMNANGILIHNQEKKLSDHCLKFFKEDYSIKDRRIYWKICVHCGEKSKNWSYRTWRKGGNANCAVHYERISKTVIIPAFFCTRINIREKLANSLKLNPTQEQIFSITTKDFVCCETEN